MDLPLDKKLTFGIRTIHRRSQPAEGAWLPDERDGRTFVELVDRLGFELALAGP